MEALIERRMDQLSPAATAPEPVGSVPPTRFDFFRAWATPWYGVVCPRRAAASAIAASAAAFGALWLFHALLLAVVIILLALWNETRRLTWIVPPSVATAPAAYVPLVEHYEHVSLGEVWAEWHRDGPLGPAEIMLVAIPFGLLAVQAVAALLSLVQTHRSGSLWRTFQRAFRAATASLGLTLSLVALLGVLIVSVSNADGPVLFLSRATLEMLSVLLTLGAIVLLLFHFGAGERAAHDSIEPPLPLRCESCGYELTLRQTDELCPECAALVGRSTNPSARPGVPEDDPAQPAPRLAGFLRLTGAVLGSPGFYRQLRLRNGTQRAERFALRTWIVMAIVGWVSIQVIAVLSKFMRFARWNEALLVPPMIATMVTLVCVLVHRAMGTLAGLYWTLAGIVPDTRWAAKIIAYESAYMWLPCLWGGLFLCGMLWDEDFIAELVGRDLSYRVFRMPPEPLVLMAGWVVLGLIWVRRLLRIGRQVRWSNF